MDWSDDWLNPPALDQLLVSGSVLGVRGNATVNGNFTPDFMSTQLAYEKVEATEVDAGTGIFTINGTCNMTKPQPTNPMTRCLNRYRVTGFVGGVPSELQLSNPNPQSLLPDGGVPSPTSAQIRISGKNEFCSGATQSYSATFE